MTQRQRAIEIVNRNSCDINEEDAEIIVDRLLASDFCSDPVKELVMELSRQLTGDPEHTLPKHMYELLRKIVED